MRRLIVGAGALALALQFSGCHWFHTPRRHGPPVHAKAHGHAKKSHRATVTVKVR